MVFLLSNIPCRAVWFRSGNKEAMYLFCFNHCAPALINIWFVAFIEFWWFVFILIKQIASEGLKHRVFEVSLADLQKDEEHAYRKIRLRAEDVQGRNVLTNFWVWYCITAIKFSLVDMVYFCLSCEHWSIFWSFLYFQGMDFTTDKLRSLVRKWQTLIEAHVDVKTTDNYTLRMFCIAFTKRRTNQVKRTCYAQSSQIRQVRFNVSFSLPCCLFSDSKW